MRRALLAVAVVVVAAVGALLLLAPRDPGAGSSLRPASTPRAGSVPWRKNSSSRSSGRVRAALVPGIAAVPVLMYHVIASPPADAPYPGLYVPPAEFARQMRSLADAGYHAVTLDAVRRNWVEGTGLPRRPIVLSFDNGYRTQYTEALPILRRHGWVGVENLQLTGLPPSQGGLSERQVRALVAAGWELDTQGFSHADLVALDPASLRYQVAVARGVLRRRFHVPVNWFCYPSGLYDRAVIAEVRAAGYVGATTVVPGWARIGDDRYRLPRLRVLGGTSPQGLLALIEGTRDAPADLSPPR